MGLKHKSVLFSALGLTLQFQLLATARCMVKAHKAQLPPEHEPNEIWGHVVIMALRRFL
jgi:hypothetical protein